MGSDAMIALCEKHGYPLIGGRCQCYATPPAPGSGGEAERSLRDMIACMKRDYLGMGWQEGAAVLTRVLAELSALRAAQGEDTARLDWLEREMGGLVRGEPLRESMDRCLRSGASILSLTPGGDANGYVRVLGEDVLQAMHDGMTPIEVAKALSEYEEDQSAICHHAARALGLHPASPSPRTEDRDG